MDVHCLGPLARGVLLTQPWRAIAILRPCRSPRRRAWDALRVAAATRVDPGASRLGLFRGGLRAWTMLHALATARGGLRPADLRENNCWLVGLLFALRGLPR